MYDFGVPQLKRFLSIDVSKNPYILVYEDSCFVRSDKMGRVKC